MAARKPSGEKRGPSGRLLFQNGVELWGAPEDPKTFEFITKYKCNNCGAEKELREQLPNKSRRLAFKAEAKAHSCQNTIRSKQFTEEAVAEEQKRRDIYG
jgi:hypothetical protein